MADDAGIINQVLTETSFLYGGNAAFVEDLHARWAENPASVDASWQAFFASLADRDDAIRAAAAKPSWTSNPTPAARPDWLSALDGLWPAVEAKLGKTIEARAPAAPAADVRAATLDSLRAIMMIRNYRMRGHLRANLGYVDFDDFFILRINRLNQLKRAFGFGHGFQIFNGGRIRGDESALRPDFGGNIRENNSLVHWQRVNVRPGEFIEELAARRIPE